MSPLPCLSLRVELVLVSLRPEDAQRYRHGLFVGRKSFNERVAPALLMLCWRCVHRGLLKSGLGIRQCVSLLTTAARRQVYKTTTVARMAACVCLTCRWLLHKHVNSPVCDLTHIASTADSSSRSSECVAAVSTFKPA